MSEMPIESVDASMTTQPQPNADASMTTQVEGGADVSTLVQVKSPSTTDKESPFDDVPPMSQHPEDQDANMEAQKVVPEDKSE